MTLGFKDIRIRKSEFVKNTDYIYFSKVLTVDMVNEGIKVKSIKYIWVGLKARLYIKVRYSGCTHVHEMSSL